jgi:FixJ family two-component response regulator
MTSMDEPAVFIVDGDACMGAATQRLLKSRGFARELFAAPPDLPWHKWIKNRVATTIWEFVL